MDYYKSLLTNLFLNYDKDAYFDTSQQQQDCILTTTSTEKTTEEIPFICSGTTSKSSTLTYYYDNCATTPATIYGSSTKEGIKRYLGGISLSPNIDTDESSFYVGDLGVLHRQHLKWRSLLPRIEPFYGNHAKQICI